MLDRIWQMQEALLAVPALESSGGLVSARDVIIDTNCVLGRGSYTMTCKGRWRGADVAVKIILYDRGTSRKLHSELLPCGATSHPNVIGTLLHFYVQMPSSLQLSTSTSTHLARSGINTPSPAAGAAQAFQVSKLDPPVSDALSSELMYKFSSNTLSNQLPYSHTLDASASGLPDLGLGSPSLPPPLRVHGISRLESTGELSGGGADGPGADGYPTAAQGPRKPYGEMLPAAVFSTSAAMSAHPLSETDPAYSHSAMMLHSSVRQPRPFAAHGRLAAEALGPLYFPQPAAAGSSGLRFASPPAGKGRQATHEAGRTNDSWELPLLSRAQLPTEGSSGRPRRDPTLLEKFSALPANSSDGATAAAAAGSGTGTGGTDDTITLAKAVDLTAAVSVAPRRPLDSVAPPPHPHQSPLPAAVVTARSPAVTGDRAPSALALVMDSSSGRHEDITFGLEVSELPSPLPSHPPPVRAAALNPLTLSPTPRTVVGPLNAAANTANTAIVTAKSATAIAMAASKLAELGSTPEGGWPTVGLTTATAGSHSNTVQATSTEPPGSQSPRIVQQAQTVRSLDPHIPLLCRAGGGGSRGHSAGMCGAVTTNAHCPSFQSLLQSPFVLQSRVSPLPASPRAVAMPMRTHGLNGPVGCSTASGLPEAAPYIPPQATGAVATQGASGRHLVAPTWVGGSGSRSSGGGSGPDGIDHRRQLDVGSIIKSVPLQPLGGQGAATASATLNDTISSDLVGFETGRTFSGLHGISMAATMSAGGTAGLPLLQPRFTTAYETQLRAGMANAAASSGITPSMVNSAYSGLLMAMASERDSNSSGVGMGLLGMASVGTSKLGLDELLERMATASSATSSRLGPTTLDAAAGGVAVMAAVSQGSNPIRSCFSLPPQSISSPSPQPVVDSGCGGLFADDNPLTSGAPTDSAATAASASVAAAATLQASASMGAADTVLGVAAFTAATVPAKRELLANVTERCGEKVGRSSDGGTGGNNSGSLSGAAACRGASLAILPSATAAMTSAAARGSSTACTAVRNVTVSRDSGQIDRREDGIERDLIDKMEQEPNRSLGPGLCAGKRGGIQFGTERERMNEGEHPQNAAVEPAAQTTPDAPIATSLVPLLPCVPTGPPLPDGISIPASEAAGGSSPTATAVQLPLAATTPAVAMPTSAARMLKHGRQRRSHSFHHRSGVSRPRSRLCLQTVGEVLLSQAATEPVKHGSTPAASSRRRWSSMCPSIGNLAVESNDSTGGDVDVASDDFGADVGNCLVKCGDGGGDDSDIHVVPAATSASCAGGGLVSECRFQLDSSSSGGPNSRTRYGGGGAMVLDVRTEHSSSTFTIDEDDLGGTFSGLMGNIEGSGDGAATASVATLSDAAGPLDLAVAIDGCNRRTDVRPGIANSSTTAAAAAQPFAAATKGVEAPYQPPLGGAGGSTSATPAVGQGLMVMNLGRSRKTAKKPPYESKASKMQQRPRDHDGGWGACAANTPVPHEQYCTCGDFGTQEHHSALHLTSTGDLPLAEVMSQHNHRPMVQVEVESLLLPPPVVPGGAIAGVTAPVVLSLPAQPQPDLVTSGGVGSEIGLSNLAAVSPLSFDPWKSGNSAYLNVQASVGSDAVIGAGGGGGGSGTANVPNVTSAPVPACPAAGPAPAPTPVPEAFCATTGSNGAGSGTRNNTFRKSGEIGLPGIKSDGHTLCSPEMVSTANSDFGEGSTNGRDLRLYTLLTPIPTAMATPHLTRRSESGPRGPDSNCAGVGPCTAGSETLSSLKGPHAVVVRALTGIRLHREKVRSYRSNISRGASSYRLAVLPQEVATALAANAAGGRSTSAPPTNASQASSYATLRTMLRDAERGDSSGSRWVSAPRRSASAHSELHDVPEASPLPYDDDPLGRPGGGGVTVATAAAAKVDTPPLNKSFDIELLPLPGSGVITTCSRNRDQSSEYLATASAAANAAPNAVPRALEASYPTSGLLLHPPPLQQPEAPGHRWSLGNTSVVPPRRTSYNNGSSRYAPTAVVAGGPAAAAAAPAWANEQRKSMPPPSVSGRALSSAPPLPPAPSPPVSPSRLICSQSAGSTHHNTTPTAPPPLFAAPAAAPLHSAGPYGTVIPGSYSSVLQLCSSHSLLENPSVTARAPCLSALTWLQSSLACGGPGSLGIVVQELASGGSLRDLRLRLGPPGEAVEMRVLLQLARQVASGLAHLHSQRLVHGDLRAANVLLAPAPEGALGLRAMVSDYGYSRLLLTGRRTLQPRPHGAPTHLAPESWAETSPSRAADIFAFGVLLWELAAGQLPWSGLNLNQIMTKVVLEDLRPPMPEWLPRGYVQLVQACWSRRPQSRPDVAGVRQWLDELLMELPPPPPLSSRLPGADLRSPGSMVLLPYTDGGATVAVSRSDGVASGRTAAAIPMADHIMDFLVAHKPPQPTPCRTTTGSRGWQEFGTAPGCGTGADGIMDKGIAVASSQALPPTPAAAGGRDVELPPFVAIEM
ncbi:hypothetical protein Vretimale_6254 [Volvox reticuliferus]|nr:hypothetical protein Vretimale_6254 [Volvox reticuliferus]